MSSNSYGCVAQRHVTLGCFVWEKGSINDNIRRILCGNNIRYRNTLGGIIEVSLGRGWEAVRHNLGAGDVCEVYLS